MSSLREFSYRDLTSADCARNAGMAMELFSAALYAGHDGLSVPAYIIKILRAERERRQDADRIARDKVLLDEVIDAARAASLPIVDYLLSGQFPGGPVTSTWKLSPDFLARLITRMEERQHEGAQPCEVDDCPRPAGACECGAAHCPAHPHQ